MRCNIICADELTDRHIEHWHALRNADARYFSPFFDPDFTRIVQEARGGVHVLFCEDETGPAMIWPFQKSGKRMYPVGEPFSDYHGPIMRIGLTPDLPDVLSKAGLTVAHFTGIHDPSGTFDRFTRNRDGAFIVDTSEGIDAYNAWQTANHSRHAKKMRRVTRKIEREIGRLTFTWDDQDEAAFEQLISWKRAQYVQTGRHDVLGPDWSQKMMRLLLARRQETGARAILHTLRHEGRLIAAELNAIGIHTLHGWIPAYDDEFSSYSPGYLIQEEIIRQAAGYGLTKYDLGVSAGHYKKYYANYQIPVWEGTVWSSEAQRGLDRTNSLIWSKLENCPNAKLASTALKMRRRYRVIRSVETGLPGRVKGMLAAAGQLSLREPEEPAASQDD